MFTKKRILAVALSAVLVACGGGGSAAPSPGELETLRTEAAAQQKTIDGLKAGDAGSAQQAADLGIKMAAQQAALDNLLATLTANGNTGQIQWQEILALRATIGAQQKTVKQWQAGARKLDFKGPVLSNFSVSQTDVLMPETLTLKVDAEDAGSGLLKVEFYEAGKNAPVAIVSAPPYSAEVRLGMQDNGAHAYYARAFDGALGASGAPASNISSNADAAVRVKVAVQSNGLEQAGNLEADFRVAAPSLHVLKPDPHHDGVYIALNTNISGIEALKIDYANRTVTRLSNGGGISSDVDFHPKRTNVLYGMTSQGFQTSTEAGGAWKTLASKDGDVPFGAGAVSSETNHVSIAPSGNKLFAYSYGGGYYASLGTYYSLGFSSDGGSSWTRSAYSDFYSGPVGPVAVAASDENVVYAGILPGVMRSSDGGRTFARVGSLPSRADLQYVPTLVSVDPFDANVILALVFLHDGASYTSKLFRSTDGGATWSAVQLPTTPLGQYLFSGRQANTLLVNVAHNRHVKGLVYVPVYAEKDSAAVLRSKDGGVSWELLTWFDPSARGAVFWNMVASWVTSTKPDAAGAVQLFLPSPNGFNRYLDRTALK